MRSRRGVFNEAQWVHGVSYGFVGMFVASWEFVSLGQDAAIMVHTGVTKIFGKNPMGEHP